MSSLSAPPDLLIAFQHTADACTQALHSLTHSTYSPTTNASPDLTSILTDYSSLLSLIYAHTTTLSLAMKPPPTYPGAFRPLSDLTSDVTKLTSCVHFLSFNHGATLHKEATWRAQEIIESIHALVQTFLPRTPNVNSPTPSDSPARSPMLVNLHGVHSPDISAERSDDKSYLVRTGAIHSAVDHAKKTLSKSNAQAVLKAWTTHTESLQDALEECEELTKDPTPSDPDELNDLDDFDDDGWGEMTTHRDLTPEERERAANARTLLKLVLSLHKRLARYTLPSISPSPTQHHTLDTFLAHSSALTASIDDLVSSLHPPHQLQNGSPLVSEHAQDLSKTITALKSLTLSLESHSKSPTTDDPIQKLAELKLSDSAPQSESKLTHPISHPHSSLSQSSNPPTNLQHTPEATHVQEDSKNRQWLTLCFTQIDKAIQALE